MLKKCFKTLIISVLMMIASSSLFAVEEYISEIYKDLDEVFIVKSDTELNEILSKNSNDKYYYLIENYTEKKIRRLIVNNDYDFAMTAIIIVIENNMDNENAVDMYSVIADAYEIQQQHEIEEEQKRQREIVRIELAKEKQRGAAEKEFNTAENASGKAVYVSGKEDKLTSYHWKGAFGMINLAYLYDEPGSINSFHYGVSGDFRYEYTTESKLVIGADLFAGINFLAFTDEEKNVPLLGDGNFSFKFATPIISKDLFWRLGFGSLLAGKASDATATKEVVDTMYSLNIGVKMERIKLGTANLDIGVDWYPSHLFYSDKLKFAAGADANIEFPFAETERVKLNINLGLKDRFFLKDSGIENRASIILAIGAENVVR